MKHDRIVVWFRNDLRLEDNETLTRALQQGKEIIPVYCFDSRHFESTSLGFAKTGAFRAQFLLESVADLRQSFQKIGGDLVILHGGPEEMDSEKRLKRVVKSVLHFPHLNKFHILGKQ